MATERLSDIATERHGDIATERHGDIATERLGDRVALLIFETPGAASIDFIAIQPSVLRV